MHFIKKLGPNYTVHKPDGTEVGKHQNYYDAQKQKQALDEASQYTSGLDGGTQAVTYNN